MSTLPEKGSINLPGTEMRFQQVIVLTKCTLSSGQEGNVPEEEIPIKLKMPLQWAGSGMGAGQPTQRERERGHSGVGEAQEFASLSLSGLYGLREPASSFHRTQQASRSSQFIGFTVTVCIWWNCVCLTGTTVGRTLQCHVRIGPICGKTGEQVWNVTWRTPTALGMMQSKSEQCKFSLLPGIVEGCSVEVALSRNLRKPLGFSKQGPSKSHQSEKLYPSESSEMPATPEWLKTPGINFMPSAQPTRTHWVQTLLLL